GGLDFPDGDAVGVELELHVKRLDRYQAAVADVDPAWSSGVWWFTPRAQVAYYNSGYKTRAVAPTMRVLRPPRGWPRDSALPRGVRPGPASRPPAPARPGR